MRRSAILASAAAALFLAGSVAPALAADDSGSTAKIRCEGVNSCRSQSDCKTAHSQCKGHNSCKGQGFKLLTPDECAAAKKALEKKNG